MATKNNDRKHLKKKKIYSCRPIHGILARGIQNRWSNSKKILSDHVLKQFRAIQLYYVAKFENYIWSNNSKGCD